MILITLIASVPLTKHNESSDLLFSTVFTFLPYLLAKEQPPETPPWLYGRSVYRGKALM